jgi:RNA polymerase sigma-70 factor (ECF subfamily)
VNTEDTLEALLQSGFRYACSLTHQHSEAEDLVQEAWLKLARRKQPVWNKALFFVTLRHLFVDRYRHTRLIALESLDKVFEESSGELASEQEVAMDVELLGRSLSMLRVEEREAIYLHLVEGYTAAEIAELTERSRNTVLSLIHRGRKKLVRALRDLDSGDVTVNSGLRE